MTLRSLAWRNAILFAALWVCAAAQPAAAQDRLDIFDQIVSATASQFYDPDMHGLDWPAVAAEHRARITPDMDEAAFSAEVNAMLARLEASHTRHVTRDSTAWYQLVGIFMTVDSSLEHLLADHLVDGAPVYTGIGIFAEARPEGTFVTGVLEGHPAARAGILVGDRIVAVNGAPYHPVASFAGRAGTTIDIELERRPGETVTLEVEPALLDATTMFLRAMRHSIAIIEHGDVSVGYVRVWCYAGEDYQAILSDALLQGPLGDADALVMDLRGGWGGAEPSYLNLFAPRGIEMTMGRAGGYGRSFASAWTKPVVLLVDEGSRSGKEVIAYGFRALDIGPIVGETTAGAVLGGRLNVLRDGSLLYVATADVAVDGVRLEGVGVAPDIAVPFDPAFAAGHDPQLDAAIEIAAGSARQ